MTRPLSLLVALLAVAVPQCHADWSQYLGPQHNATSTETGLLHSWPASGPTVLWTVPLNRGYAGPAISGGKVYVLDRVNEEQEVLRCFDFGTGKEDWTFEYPAPGKTGQPGSRTVPAVDGNRVYICGSMGHLHCIDITTHQPVWKAHIWDDFGGRADSKRPQWYFAQNPLVYKDLLIVASQSPEVGVVAFDKLTGAVRWKTAALPCRAGYVSPTIVNIEGVDQVVMVSAGPSRNDLWGPRAATPAAAPAGPPKGPQGAVQGFDPASGKLLWSYEGFQCQTPVANVTAIGDGRLFISGGYRAGSTMFKVTKQGDAFAVTELFKTDAFGVHVHPAALAGGCLYGDCTDNTGRSDGLVCMDLDGNVKWKTGSSPLFDKGGMIVADGIIIAMDGAHGWLYLIQPDSAAFDPLAKARLLATDSCWAPLALTDGKLLIRDQRQMKCVALR